MPNGHKLEWHIGYKFWHISRTVTLFLLHSTTNEGEIEAELLTFYIINISSYVAGFLIL